MWFRRKSPNDPLRLEEVFENYEIPVFAASVHEVLRMIRDDETSNADIARGLELDPGISVKVLRLVNSAGFGLRQSVEDLSQAVQLIGRSSLESLLISVAVRDTLPLKARPGFSPRAFWRTAAQRAAIAGRFAADHSPTERSACWTAALLQDLAIPLLVDHFGDRYCELLSSWAENGEPLADLEREAVGVDHAEIGHKICERWGFPARLTEAIGCHHEELTAENAPSRLVAFLRPDEAGEGSPLGVPELLAAAESIGLDPASCERHVELGLEDATALIALLS